MVISSDTSVDLRPMKRLMEKMVFSGLVTAWRLAGVPTSRCPSLLKATTDGVVRPPSLFSMTVGSPPSRTAMHELVVPRSMPMTLPMLLGNLRGTCSGKSRAKFDDAHSLRSSSLTIKFSAWTHHG